MFIKVAYFLTHYDLEVTGNDFTTSVSVGLARVCSGRIDSRSWNGNGQGLRYSPRECVASCSVTDNFSIRGPPTIEDRNFHTQNNGVQ